jgi:hypothetical protein
MAFEILTLDGDVERVDDADAYQLEGPLTTFFIADGGHGKLSSWSQRVCSLRTDRISSIRRVPCRSIDDMTGSDANYNDVPNLRAV